MAKIFRPKPQPLPSAQELTIRALSPEGRGIAQLGKQTVFCENALPGETVTAKFVARTGQQLQAVAIDHLQTSVDRVQPGCNYAGQCGGCEWLHIQANRQIELKQQLLLENLWRQAKLEPRELAPAIASSPWEYRNRARLAVWRGADRQYTLGFRALSSKQVVPVEQCLVLVPELSALIPELRHWMVSNGASRALGHVEVLSDEQRKAVLLRLNQPLSDKAQQAVLTLAKTLEFDLWLQPQDEPLQCISSSAPPLYSYRLHEFNVTIDYSVTDFTQVNSRVNERMVAQACDWICPQSSPNNSALGRVLDLFCGVGNFSLPLATMAKQVVGVELSASMVERAAINATQNGMDNALFVGADLNQDPGSADWARESFEAALLDPPRSGAKEAVGFLEKLAVPRLVYVSCNPATFTRDAKMLAAAGYCLDRLGVMDMFPQTKHTESMALFTRS